MHTKIYIEIILKLKLKHINYFKKKLFPCGKDNINLSYFTHINIHENKFYNLTNTCNYLINPKKPGFQLMLFNNFKARKKMQKRYDMYLSLYIHFSFLWDLIRIYLLLLLLLFFLLLLLLYIYNYEIILWIWSYNTHIYVIYFIYLVLEYPI